MIGASIAILVPKKYDQDKEDAVPIVIIDEDPFPKKGTDTKDADPQAIQPTAEVE